GAADFSGAAHAPARRGDRARVCDLHRRIEKIEAFEKKRPLLRKENGEALIDGDLRNVGLDLRKIGIEREIDRAVRRRVPLHIDAGLRLRFIVIKRAAETIARRFDALRSYVRRGDEMS